MQLAVSDDLLLLEQAVFLPAERTLLIADLQLGYEQQLRALGHNILYEQAARMLSLLERLIERSGATRLVINGDLKHEFGRISGQERRDVLGLLRRLKARVEIVLVKGNHDTMTAPLAQELGLELRDSWSAGGFLAVHGHVEPDASLLQGVHTVIIGHMHPAIRLSDGIRSERYKCFLVGKYDLRRLVVLPSFSTVVEGSDVLTVNPNTPLLTGRGLERCEVYVLADEIKNFGTIARLRSIVDSG